MKVSIKRWSSVKTFRSRERRVVMQILFYVFAIAARFPVFETTNVLLYPLGTVTPSQKPVIYKSHKGGINKWNWVRTKCVLFATEGHFHSRDMSLKTISSFVACWSRRMLRMYNITKKGGERRGIFALSIAARLRWISSGKYVPLLSRSQSHTRARNFLSSREKSGA